MLKPEIWGDIIYKQIQAYWGYIYTNIFAGKDKTGPVAASVHLPTTDNIAAGHRGDPQAAGRFLCSGTNAASSYEDVGSSRRH